MLLDTGGGNNFFRWFNQRPCYQLLLKEREASLVLENLDLRAGEKGRSLFLHFRLSASKLLRASEI